MSFTFEAPSERELAPKATEGACVYESKALVLCRAVDYNAACSFRFALLTTSLPEGGKSNFALTNYNRKHKNKKESYIK